MGIVESAVSEAMAERYSVSEATAVGFLGSLPALALLGVVSERDEQQQRRSLMRLLAESLHAHH